MNQFLTWEILKDYGSFVSVVFALVAFTKELPCIRKIPTKYWSAFISFSLLVLANIHYGTFTYWNLLIYPISSVFISLGANGLANFNSTRTFTKTNSSTKIE